MTINERLAVLETQMQDIRADTRCIRDVLRDNGRPGLVTRLDRAEQKLKNQCFWLRTLGVVLATAMIKITIDLWLYGAYYVARLAHLGQKITGSE